MTKEELEKEAEEYLKQKLEERKDKFVFELPEVYIEDVKEAYLASAEPREKQIQIDAEQIRALQKQNGELADELILTNNECKDMREELKQRIRENQKLCEQIEKMKWHKLDWDKAEENPDVDKLVRVRTRSGAEYICETYSYFPAEDEIGYGSVITQFSELNGDWVDDNEIEYWCYIEPFKEIKEK